MTDEINNGTFEPVGPANEDIATPVKDFMILTEKPLKVGDLVHTSRDGDYRVVEGGVGGWVNVVKIDMVDAELHHLEVYGIQVR